MEAGREKIYETWMMQQSDLIQSAAKSFGERVVADAFAEVMANNPDVADELKDVFHLYLVDCIDRDLADFMIKGILDTDQAEEVRATK
ncbi:unnamed protein product, partial [Cyprideis torosa]